MKLSDKVFIQEAIVLLELQNKPLDYVIHELIHELNLPTYFDVNVAATESTGYEMETINYEGDEAPFVNGNPPESIEGPGKKILEGSVEKSDVACLSVLRFEHEGKQYCGADEEGCNLKPTYLDSDSIYFDKSDLDSYVDKPPYQDKDHEYYAPELDIAIQLHKAIYLDKYGRQDLNREQRISMWLNQNSKNKEYSSAAISRLSTVIGLGKSIKK
jgi:hypothetical protein